MKNTILDFFISVVMVLIIVFLFMKWLTWFRKKTFSDRFEQFCCWFTGRPYLGKSNLVAKIVDRKKVSSFQHNRKQDLLGENYEYPYKTYLNTSNIEPVTHPVMFSIYCYIASFYSFLLWIIFVFCYTHGENYHFIYINHIYFITAYFLLFSFRATYMLEYDYRRDKKDTLFVFLERVNGVFFFIAGNIFYYKFFFNEEYIFLFALLTFYLSLVFITFRWGLYDVIKNKVKKKNNSMKINFFQFNFETQLFVVLRNYFSNNFTSIKVLLVISLVVVIVMLLLAYVFSFSVIQNKNQLSEYECGFEPFDNATRTPFDVHFYIVGILFLIFDVEISLLFPWVVSIAFMKPISFFTALFFILILAIGFYYEWKMNGLTWANKVIKNINLFMLLALIRIFNSNNSNSENNWWTKFKSAAKRFFFETWDLNQWIKTLIVMFFLYWLLFYIYNSFVAWKYKDSEKKPYIFSNKSIILFIISDLILNFAIGIRYMYSDLCETSFAVFLAKCPIAISPFILFLEVVCLVIYLF